MLDVILRHGLSVPQAVRVLLRTGVEKDAVVADVVKQLGELGAMMVAGGMPVLNGVPEAP